MAQARRHHGMRPCREAALLEALSRGLPHRGMGAERRIHHRRWSAHRRIPSRGRISPGGALIPPSPRQQRSGPRAAQLRESIQASHNCSWLRFWRLPAALPSSMLEFKEWHRKVPSLTVKTMILKCRSCFMRKLPEKSRSYDSVQSLYSRVYIRGHGSVKDSVKGQDGILPRIFKSVIAAGHPEFSSMRQQAHIPSLCLGEITKAVAEFKRMLT